MKTFETKAFIMKIHDDLLVEFLVKKNVNLQASDLWESRDLSTEYIPHKKFFVLFEVDEDAEISGDARRADASQKYNEHVAACALYSDKMYLKIIGTLYLSVNKPVIPTKFFDDREEALLWLKDMQNKLTI